MAYVLPVVQQLQFRLVPKIRCLIVVPVQELAVQVHKVVITYTSYTNLKAGLITGASSFEQEQNNIIRKSKDLFKTNLILMINLNIDKESKFFYSSF